MPRNGSGTYSPPAGTAGVSLQPISSTAYDNFLTDISSEMTNSLPTTGVKAMGANLPMGGNQIKNMADPTVSTDGATKNYTDNVAPHRLVNIRLITTTGTITPTTGATLWDLYAMGGSGGSGGCGATSATQVAFSAPTASGSYAISLGVAAPASAVFTIGAFGAAGVAGVNAGGNGGTTTVVGTGINISCPGSAGSGGGTPFTIAGASLVSGRNALATVATGGNLINSTGFYPTYATVINGVFAFPNPGFGPFGASNPGSGADCRFINISTAATAGAQGNPGYVLLVERA